MIKLAVYIAERGGESRRVERDRDRIVISLPEGWHREKPMSAREWYGDSAWLGGSLEELQQFHNCFPFFCSLNCFPRSTVLSEVPPPTPCRSNNRSCSLFVCIPLKRKRASTIRRTFRYYRFSADEWSGNDGRADYRKKHPSPSSLNVP